MNHSPFDRLHQAGWEVRHAIRWRWRRWRGLSGEFVEPEDSERSRALTADWHRAWPRTDPIGYLLKSAHPDRWVRFHSLPSSKRYAETPDEYAEVLRRHRTVLLELLAGSGIETLIVIANDWDSRDLATGWSRAILPSAWPWRSIPGEEPELGFHFFWVTLGITAPGLDRLFLAVADDRGHVVIADHRLEWLYHPYDGGADVILHSSMERDALRERHSAWLSQHPGGL